MGLIASKAVKSQLQSPVILLFDPELRNNKLEIKVVTLHSLFIPESPLFSELPFRFNLDNTNLTGLDVLFYGQDHYDTMSILDDKREINQETIGDLIKGQKILSNRNVMKRNLRKLIESLTECELYIDNVVNKNIKGDADIGRMMNKCMGQFNNDDMEILEQLVRINFTDAMMNSSLQKL